MRVRTTAVLLLTVLVAAACGGGSDESAGDLLARAKTTLDDASSVHFVLSSAGAPAGGTSVVGGEGDIARPSSFSGTLSVQALGSSIDAQVISVDGTVYAQLPLTTGFSVVDPATLGFGDPGALIDPDDGISPLLTAVESPELGDESRVEGEVVQEVTGQLPGDLVESLLTTADPEQPVDAVFSIASDSGELRQVQLTGPFFTAGEDASYTIVLSDFGADVQITAPATG